MKGLPLVMLLAALLMSAVPAAPAAAETVTLRGKTSQGLPFSARITDGRLTRLHFRWRARCNRSTTYRAFTTWLDGPERVIEQDAQTFSDSGTVRHRDRRRRLSTVRSERIAGTFSDGMAALKGTHRTTVRIRERGRLAYRCSSSIRFSAKR